jgi:cell division control protein 6
VNNINFSFSGVLKSKDAIFKKRNVLKLSYDSDELSFRDEQLKIMAGVSKGIIKGQAISNMLLQGNISTGKTLTMRKFFELIKKEYSKVECVYIECHDHDTRYKVLIEIYKVLTGTELNNGVSTTILFNEIIKEIIIRNLVLVVGLDECNNMRTQEELNELYYSLLRASEKHKKAQISVIASTSKTNHYTLNKEVMTVYQPLKIQFPAYTIEEIHSILKKIVDKGLQKGTIKEELIHQVAWCTFAIGDLRYGIEILSQSTELAEQEKSTIIEEKHIINTIQHHTRGGVVGI